MMPVDELAEHIKKLQLNWINPENIICTNMTDGQKNDVNDTILFYPKSQTSQLIMLTTLLKDGS